MVTYKQHWHDLKRSLILAAPWELCSKTEWIFQFKPDTTGLRGHCFLKENWLISEGNTRQPPNAQQNISVITLRKKKVIHLHVA